MAGRSVEDRLDKIERNIEVMMKTQTEILQRLVKVETKQRDLSAQLSTIDSRLQLQNGRLWDLGQREARMSGKVAMIVVLIAAAVSAALSVIVSLFAK